MFLYGNPVPPDQFVGRRSELRRIASRLAYHGQSTAVLGEPRSGKTSLLAFLAAPAGRAMVKSDGSAHLVFSYLDAHALPNPVHYADFWARALSPLSSHVDPDVLAVCSRAAFEPRVIQEQLFEHMRATNVRLVLVVDELDDLVRRRVADPISFFGALRSLGSLAAGALAIVAASRMPLKDLEAEVQRRGYTGSPPFNFMTPQTLGPLAEEEVEIILDRGRARFSAEDRRYVREVAGGHPYLVQAAAGLLWHAYDDEHADPRERRAAVGASLRECSASILRDIWEEWPAALRLMFASATIEHIDALSGAFGLGRSNERGTSDPLADAIALHDELADLNRRGFVIEDGTMPFGRRVQPIAFLAWCTKELRRRAASPQGWEAWLREQGWESYLTEDQRRVWLDRVRPVLRRVPVDIDALTCTTPAPPKRPSPSRTNGAAVSVYMSCAAQDQALLDELEKHLAALVREGKILPWSRRDVTASEDWHGKADERLRAADIVLLCVSADYVASDYCYDVEVALSLQRWRLGETHVIPVLLRATDWKALPFGTLDPLPRSGRAVASWTSADDAWVDVAQGIRQVVDRLGGRHGHGR